MDYVKIYDNLVLTAKRRNVKLDFFEMHYIKPKCCGGDNNYLNLVKFTFREHYLAHKLLVKIYPDNNMLINWKTNTHVIEDIVEYIKNNQNLIIEKTKEFLKVLNK